MNRRLPHFLAAWALVACGLGIVAAPSVSQAAPSTPVKAAKAERAAPTEAVPGPHEAPQLRMRQLETTIRKILSTKTAPATPRREEQRQALVRNFGKVFDFDTVARESLKGAQWEKLNPEQRQRFSTTLRALIERTYLARMIDEAGDGWKVRWPRMLREGGQSEVDAEIAKGREKVEVTFVMRYGVAGAEAAANWWITDLRIDDVSMVENYRSQFNRILRKEGFEALMKRMEDKLAEAQ